MFPAKPDFTEPLWRIVHTEAYHETKRTLLRDWLFFGTVLVASITLGAWINNAVAA